MNMKFIPSRIHGLFDYVFGLLLVILPFLWMPVEAPVIATIILVVVGAMIITMALFTNYEMGIVHKIGMANHLMIDNGFGIALAVTPWIFGFYEITYGFHLIAGIVIILFGMFTNTLTSTSQVDTKAPGEITKDYPGKSHYSE